MGVIQMVRKFWLQFVISVLLLVMLMSGVNYIVDPMFHFHAPLFGFSMYMNNAIYQTPGAARNLTYDAVLTGSSMTENFHASWFEEMGVHAVKLSYSGARTKDIATVLEAVYDSPNEVKLLILDINDFQLVSEPVEQYQVQPDYMYHRTWWGDLKYLINGDVLMRSAERGYDRMAHCLPDADDSYVWEDPKLFSKEMLDADCAEALQQLYGDYLQGNIPVYDLEGDLKTCQANLDNILPYIEAHPETQFVFYYPPYSIRYWERQVLNGRLDHILALYRYSMERLMEHENVKIYYFQDYQLWTTDPDNYRDECHHNPLINREIFEAIRDGEGSLKKGELEERFQHTRELAWEYTRLDYQVED